MSNKKWKETAFSKATGNIIVLPKWTVENQMISWRHRSCGNPVLARKLTKKGEKTYFCVICNEWLDDDFVEKHTDYEIARQFWRNIRL